MQPLSRHSVLAVWEQGRHRHPIDRALLLSAHAQPERATETLADQPLGQRNLALLRLRQQTYGSELAAYLDCPSCGERLEFNLNSADLLAETTAPKYRDTITIDGLSFRLPTSRDLAQIATSIEEKAAADELLAECLISADEAPNTSTLTAVAERVAEALEDADPAADLALDFVCDNCAHRWEESFDIAVYLWEEVAAHAQRLLDDIHVLATAYGWTEDEVLRLSDIRRMHYLKRVLM